MKILSLAGEWQFTTEDSLINSSPDLETESWRAMELPRNWFLGGLDHHGVVWFRRSVNVPVLDQTDEHGRYFKLQFEGVDYFADVYLNGIHLGHHEGYFEPFAFDITQHLRAGENTIAVRVDSPYEEAGPQGWHMYKRLIKGVLNHHDCRPGGGWEPQGQSYNTGGIWNDISLIQHGAITMESALLRADVDRDSWVLQAELSVTNRSGPADVEVQCDLTPSNFDSQHHFRESFRLQLPNGSSSHNLSLSLPGVSRWHPWDRGFPHLYRVRLTLAGAETKPAVLETEFGFREVFIDDHLKWRVNGQPYFPRGSNYIATQWLSEALFPQRGNADPHPFPAPHGMRVEGGPGTGSGNGSEDSGASIWFKQDVELMKRANLNTIRVHAHVLPGAFHEVCDHAGILVWQDFPFQWGYCDDPAFHREAERQIKAMVRLLHNHPSIVTWCVHNESPWDAPWMAEEAGGSYDPSHNRALDAHLAQVVRKMDPSRYCHMNSGTGDGHAYPGWYYDHWRDYAALPEAPFPTEYGAQGLPVKEHLQHMFRQFGTDAGHADLIRIKAWLDSRTERVDDKGLPADGSVPAELEQAFAIWQAWRFHNFQPHESFWEDRTPLGSSLEEFIANSQRYQNWLIQYGTECYRRGKGGITGVLQFMFVDPWPAITWSVLDYWRTPKPSFEILARVMQPVLPTIEGLYPKMEPVEQCAWFLYVTNDQLDDFPDSRCDWTLTGPNRTIEGVLHVDIPANGVTGPNPINVRLLTSGKYTLSLRLCTRAGERLGENQYGFQVLAEG